MRKPEIKTNSPNVAAFLKLSGVQFYRAERALGGVILFCFDNRDGQAALRLAELQDAIAFLKGEARDAQGAQEEGNGRVRPFWGLRVVP